MQPATMLSEKQMQIVEESFKKKEEIALSVMCWTQYILSFKDNKLSESTTML